MKIVFALYLAFSQVTGQICDTDVVYPQLSCGKGYLTQISCRNAGCCWSGTSCYAPKVEGYNFVETLNEPNQITGTLNLVQDSGMFSSYGSDFTQLSVDITLETSVRTHMKITPVGESRWEVPEAVLPRPGGLYNSSEIAPPGSLKTTPLVTSTSPFGTVVQRSNSGTRFSDFIFNFTSQLIFKDQYLQFVLQSPDDVSESFGFGESTRKTQRLVTNTTYSLWASDILAATFDTSLYGVHPFIVQVKTDGRCHGILFLNSNAMELTLSNSAHHGQTLGIQSTGGVIDIYVFSGPTPEAVIMEYLKVVGNPAFVPYWSLGFHNCRWGYKNLTMVEEVVANYSKAGIPLETQWVDIDYMDAYLDFTTDPINFPQARLKSFVDQLHANNQHFVPIVDPGIYVANPNYSTYSEGIAQDVFIKDLTQSSYYLGQVWPGPTYFPDWFSNNTQSWWTNQFSEFSEVVNFDGIWIDMNELSNECNPRGLGQVCELDETCSQPNGCCTICSTPEPENQYDFPPFVPHVFYPALGAKSIAPSSMHAGDILDYNAHSLYGLMESIATRKALLALKPNNRPFILSRSTYPGSGVHTAHWTGDNAATWDDLSASIITMNNMALFGIPMIGADICGFSGTTTEELCTRWIEVGAFSPFSRDHNADNPPPQELYRWESTTQASIVVLGLRYQLLPHLYTLMYEAHTLGRTVHNALWMHFPHDLTTHTETDGQYMWSGSILFTPVLTEGAVSVTGYFPSDVWYPLLDGYMIDTSDGGRFVDLETPLLSTNVHLRGGHVIPMQQSAMTTAEVHASPFRLVVATPRLGTMAVGRLYLDDGTQNELTKYSIVNYHSDIFGSLTSTVVSSSYSLPTAVLSSIEIWGGVHDAEIYCSAILTLADGGVVVKASASEMVPMNGFNKVVFTFDTEKSSVNIVSNYTVTYSCSDTKEKSSSDDDESGWDALPLYGQALIIVGCCLAGVGLLGGAYIAYSRSKRESLEHPLL